VGGTDDGCRLCPIESSRSRGRFRASRAGRASVAVCVQPGFASGSWFRCQPKPVPARLDLEWSSRSRGRSKTSLLLSRFEDNPSRSFGCPTPPVDGFRRGGVDVFPLCASRVETFDARLSSMANDCSWADDLHLTERTLEIAAFESLKCVRRTPRRGRDSWRITRPHIVSGMATYRA